MATVIQPGPSAWRGRRHTGASSRHQCTQSPTILCARLSRRQRQRLAAGDRHQLQQPAASVPVAAGATGSIAGGDFRWVAVIWLVTAPRLGEAKPGDCQRSIRPLETPRCLGSAPAAQHDSGSSFDRQGCCPVLGEQLASDSRHGCGRASRVHLRSL